MTSNPGLSQLSPYLNFDPAYLQTSQPEFIALEGASQKRGRFELAFSQIGGKMHKMVFKFVYKEGFCLYAYMCTLPPLHMQILRYVHTHTEIISKHNWGRRLPYTRNFILDFCSDKDYVVMIVLKIFSLLLNSKELLSTPSTAIHVQVFKHQANFVFLIFQGLSFTHQELYMYPLRKYALPEFLFTRNVPIITKKAGTLTMIGLEEEGELQRKYEVCVRLCHGFNP